MENKCSKCKTVIPADTKKPITCDICKVFLCRGCSQLSSSEVKVIELAQRRMTYACSECIMKPNDNEINKEMKKLIEAVNEKIKKIDEDYMQKTEHLLNVIEQRDINMKKFVKEQVQELKNGIESHINKLNVSTNKNIMEKNKEMHKNMDKKTTQPITVTPKIITTKANNYKTNPSPMTTRMDKPNTSKNYYELEQAQREIANRIINLGHIDTTNGNGISLGTVGESITFSSREQSEDDRFIQVTRKKWRRRGNIGTGDENQDDNDNFEGSAVLKNKRHWLIIKKVKDNADMEKIKQYLKNKLKAEEEDISVKKLDTYYKMKDNNCYLIGFDKKYMNSIYEPKLWPKGVIFDRFDFHKGQRFLDNPKHNQNGVGKKVNEQDNTTEDFHIV